MGICSSSVHRQTLRDEMTVAEAFALVDGADAPGARGAFLFEVVSASGGAAAAAGASAPRERFLVEVDAEAARARVRAVGATEPLLALPPLRATIVYRSGAVFFAEARGALPMSAYVTGLVRASGDVKAAEALEPAFSPLAKELARRDARKARAAADDAPFDADAAGLALLGPAPRWYAAHTRAWWVRHFGTDNLLGTWLTLAGSVLWVVDAALLVARAPGAVALAQLASACVFLGSFFALVEAAYPHGLAQLIAGVQRREREEAAQAKAEGRAPGGERVWSVAERLGLTNKCARCVRALCARTVCARCVRACACARLRPRACLRTAYAQVRLSPAVRRVTTDARAQIEPSRAGACAPSPRAILTRRRRVSALCAPRSLGFGIALMWVGMLPFVLAAAYAFARDGLGSAVGWSVLGGCALFAPALALLQLFASEPSLRDMARGGEGSRALAALAERHAALAGLLCGGCCCCVGGLGCCIGERAKPVAAFARHLGTDSRAGLCARAAAARARPRPPAPCAAARADAAARPSLFPPCGRWWFVALMLPLAPLTVAAVLAAPASVVAHVEMWEALAFTVGLALQLRANYPEHANSSLCFGRLVE